MIFKSNQDPETPVLPRDFSYLYITSKIFLGFVRFVRMNFRKNIKFKLFLSVVCKELVICVAMRNESQNVIPLIYSPVQSHAQSTMAGISKCLSTI